MRAFINALLEECVDSVKSCVHFPMLYGTRLELDQLVRSISGGAGQLLCQLRCIFPNISWISNVHFSIDLSVRHERTYAGCHSGLCKVA